MLLRLIDVLFPPRESELLVRSVGDSGLEVYLEPLVCELESCEVIALLPYGEPPVQACIIEAKFHANETSLRTLGVALASYLREELDDKSLYEERSYILVPIPLSRKRLRERGYNQAEATARHAVTEVNEREDIYIALDSGLLVRVRDTLPQTTLDGQARRKNMRGAFGAARTPDPYVTYVVIDDVVTTGATIGEAVRTLYDAGARDVWAVALAHSIGKRAGNAVR